jgi:hypothetical protein
MKLFNVFLDTYDNDKILQYMILFNVFVDTHYAIRIILKLIDIPRKI